MQSRAEFAEFWKRGGKPVYRGRERFPKKDLYLTQPATDNTGSAPHSVDALLFQNLAKLMSTYRLEYTTAVPACHMGMVYTLEEAVQMIARDGDFDDTDLDWHETPVGITVVAECKRESRSVEIARLIPVAQHTNEQETLRRTKAMNNPMTSVLYSIVARCHVADSNREVLEYVASRFEPAFWAAQTLRWKVTVAKVARQLHVENRALYRSVMH
jgi:hypothetical protein